MSACALMTKAERNEGKNKVIVLDKELAEFWEKQLTAKRNTSRLAVTASTQGLIVKVRFMLRKGTKTRLAFVMEFEGTYAWYNAVSFEPNPVNIAINKKTIELMQENNISPEEVYSFREKHRDKERPKKSMYPCRLAGHERNKTYQREYRKLYRKQNKIVTEEQRAELKRRLNIPTEA